MQDKTIGWIGTGLMGEPMAKHLVSAGYTLNIYNRTRSKVEELLRLGCNWCNSPAEVTSNSDIVFTMISLPKDVEDVYFRTNGIFKSLKPGMILIDMTTTKPSLSIRIFDEAKRLGASSIDAPVSGGEVGAINGSLSIMIGGEEHIAAQLKPLFEILGQNIIYQGKAGAGQHTKMCNQIAIAGTMIGVCESLVYGVKAGLDLNAVISSISKGAAACWTLNVLAPKIIEKDFAPGFMVNHFVKDLGIALEEAELMQLSLPGLALAKQLYLSLIANKKEEFGTQALYMVIAKMSNLPS